MTQPMSLDEAARVAAGVPAAAEKGEPLPPIDFIEIDVTDKRGRRYAGRFEYHVPTLGDQMQIARIKALMLPQGAIADPAGSALVDCLGYLQVTLRFSEQVPKPAWYQPEKAYSAEPYFTLYRRCLDYEAAFHGERPLNRGAAGSDRDRDGEPERDDRVSVGRKVQPPAQRRETLAGDGPRGA